jgi:hypothetical protein
MMVLAGMDGFDGEPADEIQGVLSMGLVRNSPLSQRLVLLPRKVRVVPPPWIVRFGERSIGLLPIVVESVHLLHW